MEYRYGIVDDDDTESPGTGAQLATLSPRRYFTETAAATIPWADEPQLGGTVKADNSLLNLGRAAIALMILWVLAAIWRRRSPPRQNERKLAERASAGTTAYTERPSAPTLKALQQSVKNATPLSVRDDMTLYLCDILGLSRGPALEAFRRSSETARYALEGLDVACYGDGTFTNEHRAQTPTRLSTSPLHKNMQRNRKARPCRLYMRAPP